MTDAVAAALAAGTWKEKKDDKGKSYYYNPTTKETCWDLAKKLSDPVEAALASGQWKEKKDDKGKSYYYNPTTKETVWDLAKKLGVSSTPAGAAADPVAAALAAGTWKEKTDDKGKKYYYNPATKETCWDLAKKLGSSPTPQDPVAAALASGLWKEKKDPSGKTYYYNTETKETCWDLAKKLGVNTPSSAGDNDDPVAAALASGLWKEKKDPSGKTYYYNTETKETCWDLAKKLGVKSAATTPRPGGGDADDSEPEPNKKEGTPEKEDEFVLPPKRVEEPKWVPPPPPAFPPPPPTARHPSKMVTSFDTNVYGGPGGSSRRSSNASSYDSSKTDGWRNYSKTQWLEELDKRMGNSSPSSSPLGKVNQQKEIKFSTTTATVPAQETLQELTAKTTDSKQLAQTYVDFKDGACQTVFGPPTADVAVATLHAASNIAELIPIPDGAAMASATLESLRREQEKALTLLQHVQGTLASQMQEAGVAFSGHGAQRQLKLNIAKPIRSRDQKNEASSLAKELGPAYQSLQPPPSGPYWRFVTEHESNALYDETSMKRARVVQQLSEQTDSRHELFDRIHNDLRDQYVLREKMWTEYNRVGANSFVDVADFVLKQEHDLKAQRAKEEEALRAQMTMKTTTDEFDD